MPRIIAGISGGIYLETPQGMKTRPTSDRAKEALFSILGDIYINKKVLDLYSGTGSLGLETLSRGAISCTFVDRNRKAIETIQKNLKKSKLDEGAFVLSMDVLKALDTNLITDEKYSCVFMDPPYDKELLICTIEKISGNDIMEKNGMLVVEHSDKEVPPDEIAGFICSKRRQYGAVNFSFYKLDISKKKSGDMK